MKIMKKYKNKCYNYLKIKIKIESILCKKFRCKLTNSINFSKLVKILLKHLIQA